MSTILDRMRAERRLTAVILAGLVLIALLFKVFFAFGVTTYHSEDVYPAEEIVFMDEPAP